jgi:signal transduction histidine kinase
VTGANNTCGHGFVDAGSARAVSYIGRAGTDVATIMLDDLAVASEERFALQCIPCNLSEIAREVVEARRMPMPTRIVHLDAQSHDLPVLADPRRIKQVLTNYLMNAFKYAPAERSISVVVEQAGPQFVRVVVQDAEHCDALNISH